MKVKQDNVKKIQNELAVGKQKVESMRKCKSREAIDRRYFQKKNVTPETLTVRDNEEVHFVETHCFCVPKHLAHHYDNVKELEDNVRRLKMARKQKERVRNNQLQNKFNYEKQKNMHRVFGEGVIEDLEEFKLRRELGQIKSLEKLLRMKKKL